MMRLCLWFLVFAVIPIVGCQTKSNEKTGDRAEGELNASESTFNANSTGAKVLQDSIQSSPGFRPEMKNPIPLDPSDLASEPTSEKYSAKILSWNVESEGANSDVIAAQLQELNLNDRYDIVVLTEVLKEDLSKFQLAMGDPYQFANTKSGYNDRIQLLFNEDRFAEVRRFELEEINIDNRYRAPLVVHLRSQTSTDSGQPLEFLLIANHLARGKPEIRQRQAEMLVEWAREQTLPMIAVGDYNFDYEFESQKGNPAFVKMLQDNIWKWIQPAELIDTNWYDDPKSPDGKDDFPGSMLDFAFAAGPAKDFSFECNVIVREGDFPDDQTTSDHRPFELLIVQ